MKIDNEAMMDEYTKRAMDESAKLALSQSPMAVAQSQSPMAVAQTQNVKMETPQISIPEPMQVDQVQIGTQEQVTAPGQLPEDHHMNSVQDQMEALPPQINAAQLGAQMEAAVAEQMVAQMSSESPIEGAAAGGIEPVSMEAAAAAAVEAIPVEPHGVQDSIPGVTLEAPVAPSVSGPLSIPETMEETMTLEV